jgi:hypothetical protein
LTRSIARDKPPPSGQEVQTSKTNPLFSSLLVSDLDPLPQPLYDELLAREATINVLDVIRGRLKVAAGVVALGDEDVVLCAVLDGLVERDGGALFREKNGQ